MKLTLEAIKGKLRRLKPSIRVLGKTYVNNRTPLPCKCLECGCLWNPTWDSLNFGYGCPKCGRVKARESFQASAEKKRRARLRKIAKRFEILEENPLRCRCRCGHVWTPNLYDVSKGHGCPKCARKTMGPERLTEREIRDRLRKARPEIRIVGRCISAPVKCNCRKCGYGWCRPSWDRVQGCPRCTGKARLTLQEVNDRLREINPMVKVTADVNPTLRKCMCLTCGKTWKSTWNKLSQGIGCPKCRVDSKLESRVRKILEEMTGWKFPKSRPEFTRGRGKVPLELDCYNENHKIAVEVQGYQHYRPSHWTRYSKKRFLEQKRRDWRKVHQCRYYGIKLIRVPYRTKDVVSYLEKRI